jgi:hypothetical protein
MNAALVSAPQPPEIAQAAKPADKATEKKPAEKKGRCPGGRGMERGKPFIKSTDGKFQMQPYGYFQSDYRAYKGDGAPSNTFLKPRPFRFSRHFRHPLRLRSAHRLRRQQRHLPA